MISAFLAMLTTSMVTTQSTASLQQSKILLSSLLHKPSSLLAATLATTLSVMDVTSTSMVFATSASTAQIGISAQVALSTLASSILVTDLSLSMNPLMTLPLCLDHTAARLATTAYTVMALFATKAMVARHTSRVTDTSALSAMIPTSVPAARLALQIHTTELIL